MLASCSERQEAMQFKADSLSIDTTVLRIAVMPTMSCLPVYYAEQSGLANKLGMKIQLLRFQAQMDIDTAIQRGHTDIAFTDLIRCTRLAQAKTPVKPIASCDEPLSLISLKTKRVKKINQMKQQMIAISRLSATDYWCDRLLDEANTSHDDIYRPQVNDVCLRAEMLRQGLVDAAMMSEPFATWMTRLGHKRLFSSEGKRPWLYVWANVSATQAQEETFLNMLDSAIIYMERDAENVIVCNILKQDYQLPPAFADTLELKPVKSPSAIHPEDMKDAEIWLNKRKAKK